jgi:hypothetical protein
MTGIARRIGRSCAIVLPLLVLVACGREERGPNGELKLRGTVHLVQTQEGGSCWKLESARGHAYELQPAQAPRDLLVDGVQAVVLAKPRAGGSFCKVGEIIDVVKVDSVTGPATTASK